MAKAAAPVSNAVLREDLPPLHFLGQIDLSELPALPLEPGGPTLPTTGYLFFFANLSLDTPDDGLFDGSWMETEEDAGAETRVIYAREAGHERQPPKGLPPLASDDPIWGGVFPAHPIAAKRIVTGGTSPVPESYSQSESLKWTLVERDWIASRLQVDIPVTSLECDDWTRYPVALKEYHCEFDGAKKLQSRDLHWVRHQMFGVAPTVQNEPGSTRQMTGRCGHPMIPLITFDTDWGVHKEFQFCDYGILQFWIKPEDLAARRFDRCCATTEGG